MYLSLEDSEYPLITAYDEHSVTVQEKRYTHPILITKNLIETDWQGFDFDKANLNQVEQIVRLKPEVILIASGKAHQSLAPKLQAGFIQHGLSPETMRLDAACRTYNLLCSEGREVVLSIQF